MIRHDGEIGEKSQPEQNVEPKNERFELKERTKELNCLYEISEIVEKQRFSPHEALQRIVNIIPIAWQYPEIACARITVNGDEYKTANFRLTKWVQSDDLIIDDRAVGKVEVCYTEERPEIFQGPFMKEEVKLLSAISWKLAWFVEAYNREKELARYKVTMKSAMVSEKHLAGTKDAGQRSEPDWQVILDILLKTDPQAHFRIIRKMMYHLSQDRNENFDALRNILCPMGTDSIGGEWCGINMPNPRIDLDSLERFQRGVFEVARQKMKPEEIMDLLISWLRQNNYRPLLLAAEQGGVSLSDLTNVLNHFGNLSRSERLLSKEDEISIRVNLIRRLLAENLRYINVAKRYISIEDFLDLPAHIIGPSQGAGKLGGKTAGVILAQKILEKHEQEEPDLQGIRFARSWYVTSDTMREFIHYNALDDVARIKYMDSRDIRHEQPFLEQVFKNGVFPAEIVNGLREILRDLNDRPIIVRSSSHQEDSFGAAFSGKYKSLFIANLGPEEERLIALMDAIAEVWASAFGPNVIEYRRERGLLDLPEDMGVLIQEVVGTRIGPYFAPAFAGVGFSNNEFRWSPRIRRDDGILRLVIGLGTRAVDRVADDYPILISPNKPELRVNTQIDEMVRYSQRYIDVINMEQGAIETIPVNSLTSGHADDFPMLSSIFSIYADGHLSDPKRALHDPTDSDLVVTFSGLVSRTPFIRQMRKILSILRESLGTPVDVEFAHDGRDLYILQCRPQSESKYHERVPLPTNVPINKTVFTANQYVTTGHLTALEYIVYVDPEKYESLERIEDMLSIAKIVGELNTRLPKRKFILMGPGRWGSRGDIKLGVPVQYREINNAAVLIDIACRKGGYQPELSFGTHFFQDLVEDNINYLPLYPGQAGAVFNTELLNVSENRISEFANISDELKDVVRLIRVADIAEGGSLVMVMDGEANEAIAYLVPPDHSSWRMSKVKEIAEQLDPSLYGVVALYLIGSTKEYNTGPGSDIDLLVHFRGDVDQQERLLGWLDEWSVRLAKENLERTGYKAKGLLDVHLVTDQDIADRTSWAVHIDSPYGAAKEIPLPRKTR